CMKYGLLEKASFIDAVAGPIIGVYRSMKPVIAIMREADPATYENFEYLATECKLFADRRPSGSYPKNFPRFGD
ncbi:MAG: hypothetical protein JO146_06060, partial [Candidatus Eremiobacteraeota bacterium]|nr:hypothetical protein [Candidatus Eremiobacteraeota bacterium]